jgi:hypothetical protein
MRLLRTALEQERTARGARARAVGRVAQERILVDDNVDKSLDLKKGQPEACRGGLPTSGHARALNDQRPQPAQRGMGAHRAGCGAAG